MGVCVWIRNLVPTEDKERDRMANTNKLIKLYVLIECRISPSETSAVRECIASVCQSIRCMFLRVLFSLADKEMENRLRLYFSIYYDFNLFVQCEKRRNNDTYDFLSSYLSFSPAFLHFFSFLSALECTQSQVIKKKQQQSKKFHWSHYIFN